MGSAVWQTAGAGESRDSESSETATGESALRSMSLTSSALTICTLSTLTTVVASRSRRRRRLARAVSFVRRHHAHPRQFIGGESQRGGGRKRLGAGAAAAATRVLARRLIATLAYSPFFFLTVRVADVATGLRMKVFSFTGFVSAARRRSRAAGLARAARQARTRRLRSTHMRIKLAVIASSPQARDRTPFAPMVVTSAWRNCGIVGPIRGRNAAAGRARCVACLCQRPAPPNRVLGFLLNSLVDSGSSWARHCLSSRPQSVRAGLQAQGLPQMPALVGLWCVAALWRWPSPLSAWRAPRPARFWSMAAA